MIQFNLNLPQKIKNEIFHNYTFLDSPVLKDAVVMDKGFSVMPST